MFGDVEFTKHIIKYSSKEGGVAPTYSYIRFGIKDKLKCNFNCLFYFLLHIFKEVKRTK